MKDRYTKKAIANMVYAESPLLALIAKDASFSGRQLVIPVRYGNPQGRNHVFASAQTNSGASAFADFNITLGQDYSVVQFQNKDLKLCSGGEASFIDMRTAEINGAIDELKRNINVSLFGDGSGSRGAIATGGINSDKITLDDPESVVNFEVGQIIEGWTTGGASQSSACTITGVDRDAGVLGLSVTTGLAAGDLLYIVGDKDVAIKGLAAWIPSTAPTSALFFNVNRSIDPQRLGGRIINGVGLPIYEAILKGVRNVARDYGNPNLVVLPYTKFTDLEQSLGQNARFDLAKSNDAVLGFRSIVISGPKGDVKVIADPVCPSNRAYVLQSDTWTMHSADDLVHVVETDGLMLSRMASADAFEVRIASYSQLSCNAPGKNGVILL
jgi:hypothetical protein